MIFGYSPVSLTNFCCGETATEKLITHHIFALQDENSGKTVNGFKWLVTQLINYSAMMKIHY